jgi:hypothetical protein
MCDRVLPAKFAAAMRLSSLTWFQRSILETQMKDTSRAGAAPGPAASNPFDWPTDLKPILEKVTTVLDRDGPKAALELLAGYKTPSGWLTNARAVCLMRLGEPQRAVDLLRGLVVGTALSLRSDVPPYFKTNFATALLLSGNLEGCLSALADVRDEGHEQVRQLRDAIRVWKAGLPFLERMRLLFGGEPRLPIPMPYPPGTI